MLEGACILVHGASPLHGCINGQNGFGLLCMVTCQQVSSVIDIIL